MISPKKWGSALVKAPSRAHAKPFLAAGRDFLLPNRDVALEFLDGAPAGLEGLGPVWRRGGDHHRRLSDLQHPGTVDDSDSGVLDVALNPFDDRGQGAEDQFGVGFVLEPDDWLAPVVIAH